ncbi:hypothetical protein [Rhizobium sp. BK602]|uniref:hypothetical protein n=1 Tax=Rhizobium sp. BK602 TaxID=2586986 RepID=UPI00160EE2B4|nr:hypothetical protein [Rhizobium sp. BK602]MBB3611592.1 hypothetical protein [Rhizobium sp. BK602]
MHNPPANDLESIARQGGRFKRMAVRIPTYLTDLKENPAWLPMFLLARTLPFRRMHWLATRRPVARPASGASMFAGIEHGSVVDALRTDGIFSGLILPDDIHRDIAEFAHATGCFGNFDRKLEFVAPEHEQAEARFGRSILSGHFFERSLDCEAVRTVQNDPLLSDVARHYLGGQAQVITTRIWWSFPTKSASEADLSRASFKYHFDLDDWRMLKFFFNLVDVDEGTGPHVFVRGSHRRRAVKHQLTLLVGHPAEEVLGYYGPESTVTLTGKAGFGFVEDPFGFHMGTVPTQKPRLMMEVGFGVSKPSRRRFHGEPVLR